MLNKSEETTATAATNPELGSKPELNLDEFEEALEITNSRISDAMQNIFIILTLAATGGGTATIAAKFLPAYLTRIVNEISQQATIAIAELPEISIEKAVILVLPILIGGSIKVAKHHQETLISNAHRQKEFVDWLKDKRALSPTLLNDSYQEIIRLYENSDGQENSNEEAFKYIYSLVLDVYRDYEYLKSTMEHINLGNWEQESAEEGEEGDSERDLKPNEDATFILDDDRADERNKYLADLTYFYRSLKHLYQSLFGEGTDVDGALQEAGFYLNGEAVASFPGVSTVEVTVSQLDYMLPNSYDEQKIFDAISRKPQLKNCYVTREQQLVVQRWSEKIKVILDKIDVTVQQLFLQAEMTSYKEQRIKKYLQTFTEHTDFTTDELLGVPGLADILNDIGDLYTQAFRETNIDWQQGGAAKLYRTLHDQVTNWIANQCEAGDWIEQHLQTIEEVVKEVLDLLFDNQMSHNDKEKLHSLLHGSLGQIVNTREITAPIQNNDIEYILDNLLIQPQLVVRLLQAAGRLQVLDEDNLLISENEITDLENIIIEGNNAASNISIARDLLGINNEPWPTSMELQILSDIYNRLNELQDVISEHTDKDISLVSIVNILNGAQDDVFTLQQERLQDVHQRLNELIEATKQDRVSAAEAGQKS